MATSSSSRSSSSRKPATHRAVQHRTRKDIWQVPTVLNVRATGGDEAVAIAARLDSDLRAGKIAGIAKNQAALNPASLDESPAKVKALNDMLAADSGQSSGVQDPMGGTDMNDDDFAAALAGLFSSDDADPFAAPDDDNY